MSDLRTAAGIVLIILMLSTIIGIFFLTDSINNYERDIIKIEYKINQLKKNR